MSKIGVLFGMEESFPPALVDYINRMGVAGVSAEAVTVGAVKMDAVLPRVPQERDPDGHHGHQQPVLVERG